MTFYRWLLRLCPGPFRREFGPEVLDLLREREREELAGAGPLRRLFFRLREGRALILVALRLRMTGNELDPAPLVRRLRRTRTRPSGPGPSPGGLGQDVRFALRTVLRHRGFAAAAVLVIALGVGLNTAIYSVVSGTILAPLPYPEAHRLVALGSTLDERGWDFASLSLPELRDVEEAVTALETVAAARLGVDVTFTGDGPPARIPTSFVTSEYLPLLGAETVRGRLFGPEVDEAPGGHPQVVVSHALWQGRLGGRDDVIGSEILLSGRPFTVVGVLAPEFRGLASRWVDTGAWIPLSMGRPFLGEDMFETRLTRQYRGLARLAPGAGVHEARAELEALALRLEEAFPVAHRGRGIAARDLRAFFFDGVETPVLVVLWGAVLVLLVCGANLAGLLLVRGEGRSRELAVRAALGAHRARLLRQLLTESLVLALLGGLLGTAVASWATNPLLSLFEVDLVTFGGIGTDWRVLLASLGAVGVVGVAFGLHPALRGSRAGGEDALGLRTSSGAGPASGGRWGLVVGLEVALAVVLSVGAGLTGKSLHMLATTGVGYDPEDLLTMRLDLTGVRSEAERPLFVSELLEEIRNVPGVASAVVWGPDMLGGAHWHVGVVPPGADPGDPEARVLAQRLLVSPGGLGALGIPLVRGRGIQREDWDDAMEGRRSVVISQRLARAWWPDENPVGRELLLTSGDPEGSSATIVGVAEEVQHRGRLTGQESVVGDVYFPYTDRPWASFSLLVRTRGPAAAVLDPVREAVAGLAPSAPAFDVATMEARLRGEENTSRFTATLLAVYAGAALLLALVGSYGVLAYTVRRRDRELAIRNALGAGGGRVTLMVLRQGLLPVTVGAGAGALVALLLSGRMAPLLFRVSPGDPGIYGMVVAGVLLTTALACWIPARRAAGLEPMRVLREE